MPPFSNKILSTDLLSTTLKEAYSRKWLLLTFLSKLLRLLFKKTDFWAWYGIPSMILIVCGRHIAVSYAIMPLAISEISYFHDEKYTQQTGPDGKQIFQT